MNKKLIAFDFNIKYRKNKFNFVNASSKKFDIMKSNDNKKNNDNFLFILRNLFRNQKYQFELQKNVNIFVAIKLTTLTTH